MVQESRRVRSLGTPFVICLIEYIGYQPRGSIGKNYFCITGFDAYSRFDLAFHRSSFVSYNTALFRLSLPSIIKYCMSLPQRSQGVLFFPLLLQCIMNDVTVHETIKPSSLALTVVGSTCIYPESSLVSGSLVILSPRDTDTSNEVFKIKKGLKFGVTLV